MSGRVPREVTQTLMATDSPDYHGNCLQAAVASILDLPLEAVPHFAQFTWWDGALELWLRGRYLTQHQEQTDVIPERRLCLVHGKSERGFGHSVVGLNGCVAWDPHPSRTGLVSVEEVVWFEQWDGSLGCPVCAADPWKPRLHHHVCPPVAAVPPEPEETP